MIKNCINCGTFITVKPSKIKKGRGKFCSRKCMGVYRSKHYIGRNNPNWKEIVTYIGIHAWVRRRLGKPIKCADCGIINGKIQWANISGKYKRDLLDWKSLCVPCHRVMDNHFSEKTKNKMSESAKKRWVLV